MKPTDFPEKNQIFGPPASMPDCQPLNAWVGYDTEGQPVTISCWELDEEEMELFQQTGRIYLRCYMRGMIPVGLQVHSPFLLETVDKDRPT